MMDVAIGFILVGMLVALIVAGTPIGVALIFLSLVGTWMVRGNLAVAVSMVGSGAFSSIAENLFSVIPLFVLMGMLVSVSGVGQDTFGVAQWLLRRVRGGLGIATVAANTLFAAVTGISVASASVFAQVAVPPMLHFGYTPRFAVGVVAGSSILGMLIPPSILMIVYGVLAEVSIGRMFLAGVIPGLIMAGAFVLLIVLLARFKPAYVFSSPGAVAVNENHSEMKIVLHPEALGEVTVRVQVEEGKVTAKMDVQQVQVKNTIEANMPQLREALTSRGLTMESIEISTAQNGLADGTSKQHQNKQGKKYNNGFDLVEEEMEVVKMYGYNTVEYTV